jgi:hypothetical protein
MHALQIGGLWLSTPYGWAPARDRCTMSGGASVRKQASRLEAAATMIASYNPV